MKKKYIKIFVFVFYIILYELISRIIGKSLLLPSIYDIFMSFCRLSKQIVFWETVILSLLRVLEGFGFAVIIGIFLAWIVYFIKPLKCFVKPLISVIRATPVASFIILTLLWIESGNVPVFISFLMVLPIIWANVLEGLENTDNKLLEMAQIFDFDTLKKIKYIYIPQCMPFIKTAMVTGLGFAWKSAVAAEVISMPKFSIGRRLYEAKAYLETPDLFAWTITVILLSILAEKGIRKLFDIVLKDGEKD